MPEAEVRKPRHIVLLCPDEMRASCLPRWGNPATQTPTLNHFAEQAVVFEQAYVNHTKCTPSRCSLLTGQYPHAGGHRTLAMPVRAEETNLIRHLKEAHGYATGLFGKNHCVDAEAMPLTFSEHVNEDPDLPARMDPPEGQDIPLGTFYTGQECIPADQMKDHLSTSSAMAWLETQEGYLGRTDRDAVPDPLPPMERGEPLAHPTLREAYRTAEVSNEQWREVVATYLDMCAFVDDQVKRVLEKLDALGIAEDTLVLFWSDHGDFAGDYGLPEKWDTCFSDNLTHVPVMIRCPGLDASAYAGLTETIDLLPTAFELCGLTLPAGVQGMSHVGDIRSGNAGGGREDVYAEGGQEPALLEKVASLERPRPCQAYLLKQTALLNEPSINLRTSALRTRDTKYILRQDGGEMLFDLEADPGELVNLADDPAAADTLNAMRLRMAQRLIANQRVDPPQDFLDS